MKEFSLKIGQDGRLSGLPYHDSSLLSIVYEDERQLEIGLKNSFGSITKLSFRSVSEINFSNVCNGSIISEIFVWKVATAPVNFAAPDDVWNVLYRDRYGKDVALMREEAIRSDGDDYIILVQCSYGGNIACICGEIIGNVI